MGFLEVIKTMALLSKQLYCNYESNQITPRLLIKARFFKQKLRYFGHKMRKKIIEKELALLLGIDSRKN